MIPADSAGAPGAPAGSRRGVDSTSAGSTSAGSSADLSKNLEIDISVRAAPWKDVAGLAELARAAVYRTLRAVAPAMPAHRAEISLVFADNDFVASLNKAHRGRPGPTNVLSFPASGPHDIGITLLGDVVLAFEVVAGEARAGCVPLSDHITHLLVHATLHLMGYDHILEQDGQIMEALETRILRCLNIADPYAIQAMEPEH